MWSMQRAMRPWQRLLLVATVATGTAKPSAVDVALALAEAAEEVVVAALAEAEAGAADAHEKQRLCAGTVSFFLYQNLAV
jgi:hypothetical protein